MYAEAVRKGRVENPYAPALLAMDGLVPDGADIAAVILHYESTLETMLSGHQKVIELKDAEIRQASSPPAFPPRLRPCQSLQCG